MSDQLIFQPPSDYDYPPLIKNLLQAPVVSNPRQQIVYRERLPSSYATLGKRICRLAISWSPSA